MAKWFFVAEQCVQENHWQITPLVTKKSLFTVTHALFFISYNPGRAIDCILEENHSCYYGIRLYELKFTGSLINNDRRVYGAMLLLKYWGRNYMVMKM